VLAIEVASAAEAEALLDAAGVSAEKRVVTTRLAPATQNVGVGCAALLATAILTLYFVNAIISLLGLIGGPRLEAAWWLGVLALLGAVVAELAFPPILTIGLDGLRLRTLFRRRFVPLSSIAATEDTPDGIGLVRHDGTVLKLKAFTRVTGADAIPILRNMVRRAFDASAARRSESVAAEALDRQGEGFTEWLSRLGRLGGTANYRQGNLGLDALAEVMDDGQAPADRRIGAAVTLAKLDGDAGRERVRIAAAATADADLRAALEAAAEEALSEEVALRAIRRRS